MNAVTQLVEPGELKFVEEDEYDGGQEPYVFPWPEAVSYTHLTLPTNREV